MRSSVVQTVNLTILHTYHKIGRIIVEDEQGHSNRAEYGKFLMEELSKDLTRDFGRGFSRSNIFNMRRFYLTYPIIQTLSGKLTWSHYCERMRLKMSLNANFMKSFFNFPARCFGDFKVLEFDHFRSEALLHTFTLSVKERIEKTDVIGMYVQAGRYGGEI